MAYRVELAQGAETELEELYLWLMDRAPAQGAAWFNGLEQAILSLDQYHERCAIAAENIDVESPVRVLLYGSRRHVYRVFFTIDDKAGIVRVIHIRQGARRAPAADELTD